MIFYHTGEQKLAAERSRDELAASGKYSDPIVTAIEPFTNFYPAEDYHLDYYERHKDDSYSRAVIAPKIEKLETNFKDDLKSGVQ